jgi:hypothetical protein
LRQARSDIKISAHSVPIRQRQASPWLHHARRADHATLNNRTNDDGPKKTHAQSAKGPRTTCIDPLDLLIKTRPHGEIPIAPKIA